MSNLLLVKTELKINELNQMMKLNIYNKEKIKLSENKLAFFTGKTFDFAIYFTNSTTCL